MQQRHSRLFESPLESGYSKVTKMTMFAKAVDVFHKIFKAAGSRLAFYNVLQAAGAAQV